MEATADKPDEYSVRSYLLVTRSRIGMATMKRLARQGMEGSSEVGLQLEEDLASAALLDDDVSEGLAAFEARRTPVFKA